MNVVPAEINVNEANIVSKYNSRVVPTDLKSFENPMKNSGKSVGTSAGTSVGTTVGTHFSRAISHDFL